MRDVQDVIETAIGGMPIEVTVEGRNRFTINLRYPRDLRQNIQRLKNVLVPIPGNAALNTGGQAPMQMGSLEKVSLMLAGTDMAGIYDPWSDGIELAQMDMGGSSSGSNIAPQRAGAPPMQPQSMQQQGQMGNGSAAQKSIIPEVMPHVPLGQIADIKIVTGPPMIKDEAGMLVGYVFVDMDQSKRDIGGYVDEAKKVVKNEIKIPPGYYLKWTGQYELLEQMTKRMNVVVPVTLILVIILLYFNFRNLTETFIVLASVPFALVGSIWLMYFLGYNFSTATWVGIIALVGLATETGIVMVLYLDHAYERRKKAGKMRDLNDIIWAHMEGTVMRVRPKLMTVGTTMIGLVPLLWAQGTGADVMKRIAAPMVGGLISSTFLTLEILPVIYTYWRYYQIKRDKRNGLIQI
jgi:Cu(I)/Ag(I) efflux system membrane protein CusA/SilA